ncbi:MAG: hypothetical protein ACC661_02590 [Verrucomicrobiales bacterium]
MTDQDSTEALRAIREDIATIATDIKALKSLLEGIGQELKIEHDKIEQLEVASEHDHETLKGLEETKKSLELTGRVQVRPIGL